MKTKRLLPLIVISALALAACDNSPPANTTTPPPADAPATPAP
ncbi:hypothetical protein [Arsenicitalea aurantiaca]|nr:hypothetical protein [Arsenicitalea aurantiaca]